MILSRNIVKPKWSFPKKTTLKKKQLYSVKAVASDGATSSEWDNARPYGDIPGPKALPIPYIGNVWRFLPFGTFGKLDLSAIHKKLNNDYGPVVKLSGTGKSDFVFLFEPEDVEKMFRNESVWPIRTGIQSLDYYRRVTRKELFGGYRGVVTSQGEDWYNFRTNVNQPMMQPRNTKMYIAPIDTVADDFIKRMRSLRDSSLEMPKDFLNELNKWALESISLVALDTRLGCLDGDLAPDSEAQKMIAGVHIMFDCIYKLDVLPSPWKIVTTPTWRKFVKAMDNINAITLKYINKKSEMVKKRRMSGENDSQSILESLLLKVDNPKFAMTMAMDMLIAGIDTTSNTLANNIYYMAINPEKQEKLFQEVLKVVPEKETPLTAEHLNELKYLKACLKETHRISPLTIGTARQAVKDLVIGNYKIPKGTELISSNMVMCQMAKHYKDPDRYIPERWLKSDVQSDYFFKNTNPFVYLPFGFGPRTCVGRRFAELELEVLLTKVIRNFKISYDHGDMTWKSSLVNTPSKPLQFKMEDRQV